MSFKNKKIAILALTQTLTLPLILILTKTQNLTQTSVPTRHIFFSQSAICWSKGK